MDLRFDLLRPDGFGIWQDKNGFLFGTDAVLLAEAVPECPGRTVDLCSGGGAVALLLIADGKVEQITTLELQQKSVVLARKSAAQNGCADRMDIRQGDIRKIKEIFAPHGFDTVCVNPPYFKVGSGILPQNPEVATARYELECTADDVLAAADYLLTAGGRLCMVHRAEREAELIAKIKKFDFGIEQVTVVKPDDKRPPNLVVLRAVKGAVSATERTEICMDERLRRTNAAWAAQKERNSK